MRSLAGRPRRPRAAAPALILVLALIGVACDASAPAATPPVATAVATPAQSGAPSAAASPTLPAVPDARLTELAPGALAVTVSDDLRVRSEPGVTATSLKYTPLLPIGTQLVVAAGPVQASGYTWFRVAPIGLKLADADQGWVAVADHDGTPWVALADDPTPGFELAAARSPDRPAGDLAAAKAAATALNAFGIALYQKMLKDPTIVPRGKGVVFSPTSIVTALAMARAGAAGATAAEMDKVLGVDGWPALGAGTGSLDTLLRSRDAAWKLDYEDGTLHQLALRTANMAFGQQGYRLEDAYLERIAKTFGSGIGLLDYINETDAARAAINAWVSRQTTGRIPELLGPPDITSITRLVLVNAVYLKAEWARAFQEDGTRSRTFTTAAGDAIKVPTMQVLGQQDIVIASGDGWKATELRYEGPGETTPLAMTLIMPDRLASFEKKLSPKLLGTIQSGIRAEQKRLAMVSSSNDPHVMDCGTYPYNTHLFMPKFGIDTRAGLVKPLKALGMKLAFDRDLADFSGMTTEDKLHIGTVIHQANIDVDEKGTEAAAATAVVMDTGGCTGPNPAKTVTLRLNRPFLFVLRDVQTGAILFMGRVTDPSMR